MATSQQCLDFIEKNSTRILGEKINENGFEKVEQ